MAVYAVGDLQGCLDPLERLLEKLRFDPATDRVWLVGDLVNRGPQSLETLRFVRMLGIAAVCVLGNHDLHLLAVAENGDGLHRGDTLQPVLDAPDAAELLDWLRRRPLLHHDATLGWTMVHAGLPPEWDIPHALDYAAEIEAELRTSPAALFANMYGDLPDRWSEDLAGMARRRFILNALTRMRYVDAAGRLDHRCKDAPDDAPTGLTPWFRVPARRSADARIVFGHWSTLGLINEPELLALDTGCVWGGALSAVRLDHPQRPITAVVCPQARQPRGQRI
ncbi:bis(5'-nucleosyl)-tetraphosphatase (symmetrical) [Acidihalobacter yilgarnensis]|uniref:Bis(5'-nucleosyl)-tetraphosphatase, symmetrical n=1 Tax=Acidihalobacter yilgarnensis TaxID=2819280 RepID=A0A1D8IQZ0_9GAMM|nr:symmetrical bis(5'-nucleosyl)-tetraphosphatase [Acidihalobacter yilgarnensis]AOU98817.1 bis(5'-nucleosyl)-tetraphosphatase (symmetrical) [Acidihalobacter yilgarnensis]